MLKKVISFFLPWSPSQPSSRREEVKDVLNLKQPVEDYLSCLQPCSERIVIASPHYHQNKILRQTLWNNSNGSYLENVIRCEIVVTRKNLIYCFEQMKEWAVIYPNDRLEVASRAAPIWLNEYCDNNVSFTYLNEDFRKLNVFDENIVLQYVDVEIVCDACGGFFSYNQIKKEECNRVEMGCEVAWKSKWFCPCGYEIRSVEHEIRFFR
ncbi:hypothetical protein [Photobacterium sp. J15]|uniref:hypothetical protein n=1 Tax=Photobacterium sp. J15 TaxID=265901 RepID=UPI0007E3A718|nr:hypothetical protein [Photobacterium sp. J15]